MKKPIIGITAFSGYHKEIKQYCGLSYDYIRAIQQAGGVPRLITPWEKEIEQVMQSVDGLLLTGGVDINPKYYAQTPHATVDKIDDVRDQVEFTCLKYAVINTMPVFGVCRGCQLINVYQGGTLHQHISDTPGLINHRMPPKLTHGHEIFIDKHSRLATIYASETAKAVSWHHQAIDQLGSGIKVVATASDGIIEAIEMPNYNNWLIGVQYHPESLPDEYQQQARLFKAFIEAC